jgi:hypothetical protein
MSQFKVPSSSFEGRSPYDEDTAKNPVIYPPQWNYAHKERPTIPQIVGYAVIALSSAYALFEAAWLLIKAFMASVR